MKTKAPSAFGIGSIFLVLAIWPPSPAAAQTPRTERLFHNSKAEVDKVVQELRASASGRLPVLEGFVDVTDQPVDHYDHAYYQCLIQTAVDASGGTRVRVTTKITAWYAASDAAESGYRTLPSNGRLEADQLDRLEEALGGKSTVPAGGAASAATSRPAIKPGVLATAPDSSIARVSTRAPLPSPDVSAAAAASTKDEDLATLRAQREAAEKQQKELRSEVANLEEILRNQAHPNSLAVVRKSGTPVLAKPQNDARVLFNASAEDEFEIIKWERDWIHVQISGVSRGWIRRAYLDLPEAFRAASSPPETAPKEPFRLVREETASFPGKWGPLRGKTVRIFTVRPATDASESEPHVKFRFARSLLLKSLDDLSPSAQELSGVVLVFDSADGGMIAATLSSLQRWEKGALSDSAFWQECYLDPPEAFQDGAAR